MGRWSWTVFILWEGLHDRRQKRRGRQAARRNGEARPILNSDSLIAQTWLIASQTSKVLKAQECG